MLRPRSLGVLLLLSILAGVPHLAGMAHAQSDAPDSTVYTIDPGSRLVVKTGKAGLLGFAGHAHVIQARAVRGNLVYRPGRAASSLHLTVPTDSLEVLTPPDTEEIRKVTESMRTLVLRTAEYPEIRLVSRQVAPSADGFHIVGALTLVGQTRELPIDVVARIGLDTLEAASTFAIKQTDFGITPFSGGPGHLRYPGGGGSGPGSRGSRPAGRSCACRPIVLMQLRAPVRPRRRSPWRSRAKRPSACGRRSDDCSQPPRP